MERLYVATGNAHKIAEIAAILPDFEIVADAPEGVVEDAPDFAGNAALKLAAVAARHPGEWCMADDSGLAVDAIGGAPGVRSARYAGEPCDMEANKKLLLENMRGVANRRARFVCALAIAAPSGKTTTVIGTCCGRIAESPSGSGGFGYDPLFVPDGFDVPFAELPPEAKNAISHRGRAMAEAKRTVFRASGASGGGRLLAWLRFFRIVNLPTAPGDVFAGAAAALASGCAAWSPRTICWAAVGACAAYLYGLADNDIVGAARDGVERPIPAGAISLSAARIARAACLAALAAAGVAGRLPPAWSVAALLLLVACVAYNRTKIPALMGACRALNVACGAAAVAAVSAPCDALRIAAFAAAPALLVFAWATFVTIHSKGEEKDAARRSSTGALVGNTVRCQLAALLAFALLFPEAPGVRALLAAGAVLLVLLRVARAALPQVSAS